MRAKNRSDRWNKLSLLRRIDIVREPHTPCAGEWLRLMDVVGPTEDPDCNRKLLGFIGIQE
jgi:hypothetical protein